MSASGPTSYHCTEFYGKSKCRDALAGMMPRLTFLTSLDYFVLASTLVVFLAMIEVVYTAHLSTNGQLEKARMLDHRARWIVPLVYFVMAVEILYLRIWL